MAKKLRVGIAGLGRIFDLNSLGYIDHPEVEIVGLCDTDPTLLQRRNAIPPGPLPPRGDAREKDLALVDLLTPLPLHAERARGER